VKESNSSAAAEEMRRAAVRAIVSIILKGVMKGRRCLSNMSRSVLMKMVQLICVFLMFSLIIL